MRLRILLSVLLLVACSTPASAPTKEQTVEQGAQRSKAASDEDEEDLRPAEVAPSGSARVSATASSLPRPLAPGIRTELVADGLQLPAGLAFAPDGRLFLSEVSLGRVRVIERGTLQAEPFVQLDEAVRKEQGLLGLALDPDFARTHHVYVYYSQSRKTEAKPWRNRLVRFTDVGGQGTDMRVIVDDLPIGDKRFNGGHNGGRLAFAPDGKLYVTLGDVGDQELAQDVRKLNGKLVRFNPDGSVPADNPVPGSPVYAHGLRNAWGLDFHPLTGVPYVTENGGTRHEEVNRIQPGGNYGSPKVQGIARDSRFIDPLWDSYDERSGISGLAFYTGDLFPQYKNDLLFCTWANSRLIRLRLAGPAYDQVEHEELLSDQCSLDVLTGPEGAIYFSTINKIQRLLPAH